jgi:hypothetical protein
MKHKHIFKSVSIGAGVLLIGLVLSFVVIAFFKILIKI